MLPHADAVNLVAPAALRMLEPPDEFPYDTCRRMAELLDHLRLDAALRELVERAKASDNPISGKSWKITTRPGRE
jgi:hypothetical protein